MRLPIAESIEYLLEISSVRVAHIIQLDGVSIAEPGRQALCQNVFSSWNVSRSCRESPGHWVDERGISGAGHSRVGCCVIINPVSSTEH